MKTGAITCCRFLCLTESISVLISACRSLRSYRSFPSKRLAQHCHPAQRKQQLLFNTFVTSACQSLSTLPSTDWCFQKGWPSTAWTKYQNAKRFFSTHSRTSTSVLKGCKCPVTTLYGTTSRSLCERMNASHFWAIWCSNRIYARSGSIVDDRKVDQPLSLAN